MNKDEASALLRQAIGDSSASFRDGQWEAIDGLVNRQEKMLVVERTGWGKSSVYFISTRILRDRGMGPTLIVSPLLALMRNQVEAAGRLNIRALTINSTNSGDWPAYHDAINRNEVDALLISPERLANDAFVSDVLMPISGSIGLLVVDEAHCISDWGHDFRPDYRRLVEVLQRMPQTIPILGTTATANNRVVEDIESQLGDVRVQRGSLMRKSLELQNLKLPSNVERLAWLVKNVNDLPGTGIIYTLTKRDADQVADWLNRNGIAAKAYYSSVTDERFGDTNSYRQHLENELLHNNIKVLVATTALGMGYDKPDLGFVIHYQAPGSIVTYYQQVGRAGRAIDRAVGILMSGEEDEAIHEFFRKGAFPSEDWVAEILGVLEESEGLNKREIEARVNLRVGQIEHVLKFLSVDSPAPVIKQGQDWSRTPVPYQMDHEHILRLTRQRETEWAEVKAYIDEKGCLMRFLAEKLDDDSSRPCGRCAPCRGENIVDPSCEHEDVVNAGIFLRRAEAPLKCRIQVAPGAFTEYGFSGNLNHDFRAETGRVLSRWGDAGWGNVVVREKRAGHFGDELVDAVIDMIANRWKPHPAPQWVTCVPSLRHPNLVPNFAQRLAGKLGLPFQPVIEKVRDNHPQKSQQNRFYQCSNLDGAFLIREPISSGPVLLIDDVVDSTWTLTIIAALLRRSGSGSVLPVALASSSVGD